MKHQSPLSIPRAPVTSSNIAAIGYDQETSTLIVEFRNGSIYGYDDVPPETADEMKASDSPGRYFHQKVGGKFAATQLHAAPAKPKRTPATEEEAEEAKLDNLP